MKKLFLSNSDLNNLVEELFPGKNAQIGYCEIMEMDTVELCNDDKSEVLDVEFFDELMLRMSHHHNMNIKSYEVLELAPFGVGFLFSF